MDEDEFNAEVDRTRRRRSRADMQKIINLVMDSPLNDAPTEEIDGRTAVKVLATKNTDLKARIILQMAVNAALGDLKSAEFLMKYGGYTPPAETEVTMDLPRIIDDFGTDDPEALPKPEEGEQQDALDGVAIYDDGDE